MRDIGVRLIDLDAFWPLARPERETDADGRVVEERTASDDREAVPLVELDDQPKIDLVEIALDEMEVRLGVVPIDHRVVLVSEDGLANVVLRAEGEQLGRDRHATGIEVLVRIPDPEMLVDATTLLAKRIRRRAIDLAGRKLRKEKLPRQCELRPSRSKMSGTGTTRSLALVFFLTSGRISNTKHRMPSRT